MEVTSRRGAIGVLAGGLGAACQGVGANHGIDVIYVPTPDATVDAMLAMAQVGQGDVLYDLGSGDGRIPVTAARRFGIRAVGVDISPERIAEGRASARAAGVSRLVRFRREDLFTTEIASATVVTLYLTDELNVRLRPRLLRELAPGSRIVSHVFAMDDWMPEASAVMADGARIYLWRVPGR